MRLSACFIEILKKEVSLPFMSPRDAERKIIKPIEVSNVVAMRNNLSMGFF